MPKEWPTQFNGYHWYNIQDHASPYVDVRSHRLPQQPRVNRVAGRSRNPRLFCVTLSSYQVSNRALNLSHRFTSTILDGNARSVLVLMYSY